MDHKIILFFISLIFRVNVAFYLAIEPKAKEGHLSHYNSHDLELYFNNKDENTFPLIFSVNLSDLTNNEYSIVYFGKMSKHDFDHPIASSDVYTNRNKKIQKNSKLNQNVMRKFQINYYLQIITVIFIYSCMKFIKN